VELYDNIGHNYDDTRCADGYILGRVINLLNAIESGHYLEIGCGTGNYTIGLLGAGYKNIVSLDPSEVMLEKAREKCKANGIKRKPNDWIHCKAENTPSLEASFDGVFCINALHHIERTMRLVAFSKIFYVLRNGGRFVIFTNSHAQIDRYWLNYYFPKAIEKLKSYKSDINIVESNLQKVGFKILKIEPYEISSDLKDKFLYCQKHNPSEYLDDNFRSNMSLFRVKATDKEDIQKGLNKLRQDCSSGEVENIINKPEYDSSGLGDYLFIVCEKQA
jgi:ubiquinone/menaquinone biosynthesis C-methylase UbiE